VIKKFAAIVIFFFSQSCYATTYLECQVSGVWDWFGANGQTQTKSLSLTQVTVEIEYIGKHLGLTIDGPEDYKFNAFSINVPDANKFGQNFSTDQKYDVYSRTIITTVEAEQQIRINRLSGLLTASGTSLIRGSGGKISRSISGQCKKLDSQPKF
jgi:hypothetical protein